MPKASRLKLAPLPSMDQSPGERLPRIRRERGFTQKEPAEKLLRTIDTFLKGAVR
jgi:hypothetical protein